MLEQETTRIPYDEYRAIGELFRAHLKTHEKQIRAVVAFGPLVTRGDTYDIDLLEVVDDWGGPPFVAFSSSAALPLRGLLRLNVLSTKEFENQQEVNRFSTKPQKSGLFDRLQQGHEVIYENPFGFVARVLSQEGEADATTNPLTFLDDRVGTRETK